MDLGIKGKIAIVPASSKGLGKAVALGLAQEGVRLTICSRNKEEILRTAEEIRFQTGSDVLGIQADMSQSQDIKNLVLKTIDKFKTVHILVNNAGGPPFGYLESFSSEDWQKALELNLLSTIILTKEVIPHMKSQGWGRIINMTSIAVKQPLDGLILSNTARAGVIGFAKSISNEFAKFNILVNNVCPGRILTDRIIHLANEKANKEKKSFEETIKSMEVDIPLQRIGNPSELANLVVFLSSEKSSYITGSTIQVDGGLVRGLF